MANGTKTPQDEDYYNRTQDLYNREATGNLAANRDQREAFENEFGGDNYKKDAETSGSDILAKKAREQEENPDDHNGFYNPSGKKRDKKVVFSLKNFKKRGPLTTLLILLLGGGIGIAGLSSPALILVHIQENFVNKYDAQNTSMNVRANRLIAKKISGDATSGSCRVVNIMCKFTRPSSKLLKSLDKNGIQALDKAGDVIDPKSWVNPFPNDRPASYRFTDSSGKPATVSAEKFSNELNTNPKFRAAFHRAYNPRFIGYSDSVFKTIETRFGFKKSDSVADAKNNDDVTKKIDESTKGDDKGAKLAAAEGDEVAEGFLNKLLRGQALKAVDTLRQSAKGSVVSLAAGAACLATDVPGLITGVARTYQMAQVIRYGMIFLSASSALKAGDATPTETSALGGLLTSVVAGKSAMDSFGMKYSLFGDTKASSNSYKKFIPGGDAITSIGGIASITSSPGVKTGCDIAMNPATGAAINATLVAAGGASAGTTLLAAAVNFTVGWTAEQVIGWAAPYAIDGTLKFFAPQIKDMLGAIFGDITQGISGEAVGDALSSGASNMMGQTANAGGNAPLSVEQAVAYNNTAQQVQLAYAEEDRATLSPFDVSNSNTMLGSLVNKLLPYTSNVMSVSGVLSTLGNITTGSFKSIFSTANAADDATQYTLCSDPSISDNDVAAGPFCNIAYGVPPAYLDEDPVTVLGNLISSGSVDPNTGNPIEGGELKNWLNLCTGGETNTAGSCKITSQKIAEYALYTIDHRVQKTMDGEDDTSTKKSTGGTDKQALAQAIIASPNVSYYNGDNPGYDIKDQIAAIADGSSDGNTAPCQVNIYILQTLAALVAAGHSFTISDINRTCVHSNIGNSTSLHLTGNAVDISSFDGVNSSSPGILPLLDTGAQFMPPGAEFGIVSGCKAAGIGDNYKGFTVFNDPGACGHVHLGMPAGSDAGYK